MKIPMIQAIESINKVPEFEKIILAHCAGISNKAVRVREKCMTLIKAGERCLTTLSAKLKVHRTTLIQYLHEFNGKGLIEFTTKGGAQIVAVNKG